jgi:hypothetical protein
MVPMAGCGQKVTWAAGFHHLSLQSLKKGVEEPYNTSCDIAM